MNNAIKIKMFLSELSCKHIASVFLGFSLLFVSTGCQTTPDFTSAENATNKLEKNEAFVLSVGDVVKVAFPATPDLLAASQSIRRDGKITLPQIPEVVAAGKTPLELQNELIDLYKSKLRNDVVVVSVEASSYAIYVSGSVLRQGRIVSDRPITALEAVMEAGVDYSKADLKKVKITRNVDGKMQYFTLDLKKMIQGPNPGSPFYLKPSDIIFVPEKFQWL